MFFDIVQEDTEPMTCSQRTSRKNFYSFPKNVFLGIKFCLPNELDIEDITWPRGDTNFYLRVLQVSLTSERSERVRDTFSTRR